MSDKRFIYEGPHFSVEPLTTVTYRPEFFQAELDLESDVFHDIRKANGIEPAAINRSTARDLAEIREFFEKNGRNFHFLFADDGRLIGSILAVRNYIQCLSVARHFQREGYGARLSMDCCNRILAAGYPTVELDVLPGNLPAEQLYRKLGFEELAP